MPAMHVTIMFVMVLVIMSCHLWALDESGWDISNESLHLGLKAISWGAVVNPYAHGVSHFVYFST